MGDLVSPRLGAHFAGIVELMPLGIPGRHPCISDFVASTLGVGVAYVVLRSITKAGHQSAQHKSLFRGIDAQEHYNDKPQIS
jgi:hypothetical protein